MENEYDYIKTYYKVPAEYGRVVKVDGKQGIIIKAIGQYIGVNFDSAKPGISVPVHPTDKVEYLGLSTPRKPTRSQQRYLHFISLDSQMTFKEYLQCKF